MRMILVLAAFSLSGCAAGPQLNESICAQQARARMAAEAIIAYLDTNCPYATHSVEKDQD